MGSSTVESADAKMKQKILNRIELKCLEMKELMLSQSLTSEYIELRVSLFRHMLLKKEGFCSKDEMQKQSLTPVLTLPATNVTSQSSAEHTNNVALKASKKHKHNQSVTDAAEVASAQKPKQSRKLTEHETQSENNKCGDRSKRCHSKNETTRLEKSKHMSSKSRSRSSSSGASGNRQQRSARSKESRNSRKSKSSSHHSSTGRQAPLTKRAKRRRRKKSRRRDLEKSRSPSSQPLHRSHHSRDKSRSPLVASSSHRRSNSSGRHCSASYSSSRSRSPSVRRRRGSPSYLDRRRITSARKRPVPYYRPSPSPSSSLSWSSLSPVFSFSHSPILRRRRRLRTGSPAVIL